LARLGVPHHNYLPHLKYAARKVNDAEGHEPFTDFNTAALGVSLDTAIKNRDAHNHQYHVEEKLLYDLLLLSLIQLGPQVAKR